MTGRDWQRSLGGFMGYGVCAAVLALTAARAVGAEDPMRFFAVRRWTGTFMIDIQGSGTSSIGGLPAEYMANRHLEVGLDLKTDSPPDIQLGVWQDPDVSDSSSGSVNDRSKIDGDPCIHQQELVAAGPLAPIQGFPPMAGLMMMNGQLGEILSSFSVTDIMAGQDIHKVIPKSPDCAGSEAVTSRVVPVMFAFQPWGTPGCLFPFGCLDLPDTGLRIETTRSFPVKLDVGGVPDCDVQVSWTLRLSGEPEENELVVETAEVYETWLPEGKGSEEEPANELSFIARVKRKGGGEPRNHAKWIRFELLETSFVPGVCMNFPWTLDPVVVSQPDLQFTPARNPGPWKPFAGHGQEIETEEGEYFESPPAILSSFDWGGTAMLKVTAELVDGTILEGHLEGEGEESPILIPKRAESSKIADHWKTLAGASGLPDGDDDETQPEGDGHGGDGLTLYEEYRGFAFGERHEHRRGNPKKKDLFVLNRLGSSAGVRLFQRVSGLAVHDVPSDPQKLEPRIVNFNHSGEEPHRVDQHALVLRRGPNEHHALGIAEGGPGLPRHVTECKVDTSRNLDRDVAFLTEGGGFASLNFLRTIVAHELLHGCNVYHHGKGDRRSQEWRVVEQGLGRFYQENGIIISLSNEKHDLLYPAEGVQSTRVYIGVEGGQHSGHDACVMRYNTSRAYLEGVFGGVPHYYFLGDADSEPLGDELCSKKTGTGVNDSGRDPRSRYGDATAGCCSHQICVNDDMSHAPGGNPTGCPAAGGAVEEEPDWMPGGGGVAPDVPLVSLSVNEERGTETFRGWPLLIAIEVLHPRVFEDPASVSDIVIAAGAGPWSSALRLEVKNEAGEVQSWPLQAAGTLPSKLTLDAVTGGLAALWISPEDSAGIPAGAYRIAATLDTSAATEGWQGSVEAEPVTLRMSEEPASLPAELEAKRALGLARYRFLRGERAAAEAVVDALLAKQPEEIAALSYKAQLLAASGKELEALDRYEQALELAFAAGPDGPEPPAELLRLHGRLQAKFLTQGPTPPRARFRRGDFNGDGRLDISDPVAVLGYLFLGTTPDPECLASANANGDGQVDLSDGVFLLAFLFLGGAEPPAPFPACGEAPPAEILGCRSARACP